MTTDQPKLAKSRLLVAGAFERDRAATARSEPHEVASDLLDQLQNLGWVPPRDLTEQVPARGPSSTREGRDAAKAHLAEVLARRHTASDPN